PPTSTLFPYTTLFRSEDSAISGGNFHAQPVAFAADMIAMALCEVGSLSERRTAVLIDPNMSELPPFLTSDSGVNSGLNEPTSQRSEEHTSELQSRGHL